jgi:hypothetical protein
MFSFFISYTTGTVKAMYAPSVTGTLACHIDMLIFGNDCCGLQLDRKANNSQNGVYQLFNCAYF